MTQRQRDDRDEARVLLERWLAEWYAPAYRTACLVLGDRREAEEAVQEAFLRLWRFRDTIPEGDGARAWLYRVVTNACLTRARGEGRRERGLDRSRLDDDSPLALDEPGPEEVALGRIDGAAVRAAVARLPETLRVPLVLRYFVGLSEREIGLVIQRRPGTVKSRLHAARRLLEADTAIAALSLVQEAT